MDRNLYNAASEGKVGVLRQHFDQLEIQTTANKNTSLHVAAQFGRSQCVAAILEVCPSLLCQVNIRRETPLHMAAREGYPEIVEALIESAKKMEQELESGLGGEAKEMLRATNVDGDTALHMAVRNCHFKKEKDKYLEVVRLLTGEDPEFEHPANNAEETPLYLAAEQGVPGVDVLATILETCRSPTYSGPGGRTALHAATLHDFAGLYSGTPQKGSTKELLKWKKDLIKQADAHGWTPLHYAACNKNGKGDPMFRDMVIGGGRNIACNPRDNVAQLAQLAKCRRRVKRIAEDKKKVDAKNYREWFQTLMVVAALIATITFAAAFAIPGGYDGNRGRDQGMVVLARAKAFKAFVITNTIAMMCSVISIFLCITGLWYAYKEDDKINDRDIARYFGAVVLILVAMFAIMFAFIAATFAMLAYSIALALSTCIIACIPFIAYTSELGKFISRLFAKKMSSSY
ncbi:hypothetical protein C3L33_12336, partial [Rhododendron williamsianum]